MQYENQNSKGTPATDAKIGTALIALSIVTASVLVTAFATIFYQISSSM